MTPTPPPSSEPLAALGATEQWQPGDPVYQHPGNDWVTHWFGCCDVTVCADVNVCPECGRVVTDDE